MSSRPAQAAVDDDKTREQLLTELQDLRRRLAVLRDGEEARSSLAAIVDSSDDAIIGKALDGTITSWNKGAERLYGYAEAEAVGRPIGIIVPPDHKRELEDILDKIRHGGRVEHHETVRITKDGRRLDVSVTISPIIDPAGQIVGASTIARDITERRRAEEALRESEDKFRVLADTSTAAIFVYQGENFVYVNEAAERLSGYSKEELLKMKFWEIAHPDFQEMVRERGLARQSSKNGPSSYETKLLTKGGEERWVVLSAGLIKYMGKPASVATFFDITERKRAEEALRESEEKFRVIADTSTVAIFVYQGENLVYVNDTFEKVTGYSKDELYEMKFWDIIHPDYRDIVRERGLARQRGEPVPSPYEVKFITKGGETRWAMLASGPIRYMGRPAGVTTFFDITERKHAEEALKEAKARAELYLDLMSHDITNMNQALMGSLELMAAMQESGNIDKTLIDNSIETITRSSRMISNVKKLTRLQAGNVPLKDVDVRKILSEVKSRYSQTNRHATINYIPDECVVRAGDLLEDVFDNLVDNAIRHSKGPVTVDITVDRAFLEGHGYCRIAVADDGPGIPSELKRKILMTIEEIGAGEKAVRRGFGLYMVRTVIDYYHGRVWVEDRVPDDYTKGSRFVVMLPAVD